MAGSLCGLDVLDPFAAFAEPVAVVDGTDILSVHLLEHVIHLGIAFGYEIGLHVPSDDG